METSPDPNCAPLEGRRAEIAAAARALIAERGFEGLRTREIADRVGINVATLHYHVPSKEALVRLVAQSVRDDFIAQHMAHDRAGMAPIDELRLEFTDFRDTAAKNPQLLAVWAEMIERARRDPEVAVVIRPMRDHWHRQIADLLARGSKAGHFRANMDPQAAATVVIGTLIAARRHPDSSYELFDAITSELERALTGAAAPKTSSPD